MSQTETLSVLKETKMVERKRINYDWTLIIAQDIVTSFATVTTITPAMKIYETSKYCKVMRQSVRELLERHKIVFNSMVKKLDVCEKNVLLTFEKVADEVFEDGETNWGRIVTVYAFAARLAMACKRNGNDEVLQNIAIITGKFIWRKLGPWILQHGGWDAFVEAFSDANPVEETIWKGLLLTAVSLGAMATILAVR
ncbi:induced myeloid leukemia cell differentiation protein Mcl-1 homolog [Gigantopelta aegis]|uniref:induced myeloid leukemia cell differentiation protein Mcl-1 homolog n=1 Tax=Gigantopelta aegis TaxID=1735272 RepID=UPI001B889B97|nr:induced myeloid leukemia cell differentiation protein Mcl-1 homolog [Gigantopelta aegis]